jgi:hypothetical protein
VNGGIPASAPQLLAANVRSHELRLHTIAADVLREGLFARWDKVQPNAYRSSDRLVRVHGRTTKCVVCVLCVLFVCAVRAMCAACAVCCV